MQLGEGHKTGLCVSIKQRHLLVSPKMAPTFRSLRLEMPYFQPKPIPLNNNTKEFAVTGRHHIQAATSSCAFARGYASVLYKPQIMSRSGGDMW